MLFYDVTTFKWFLKNISENFKNQLWFLCFMALIEIDDRVMNAEQRKQYMFERKVPADAAERDALLAHLKRVFIHNGYHTEEVRGSFARFGITPTLYYPEKSTEPHYFDPSTGNLHIVNSRGEIRLMRDLDLFDVVREIVPSVALEIDDYKDAVAARVRFREFAAKKVESVFAALEQTTLKKDTTERKRMTLLFGPHVSLPQGLEALATEEDDYLNYKLFVAGEEPVISFDYIFADQARYILEQMCFLLNASGKEMDVHVFHYGKVGLLAQETSVGQIVIPTGSLDEKTVLAGRNQFYPIYNKLVQPALQEQFASLVGERPYQGASVNTVSVLQQRRSNLEIVKQAGGSFLDMEWGPMAGLVQGFPSSYPRIRAIDLYFAGVGSDKPLEGATLGETKYPRYVEKKVVAAYLDIMKSWK